MSTPGASGALVGRLVPWFLLALTLAHLQLAAAWNTPFSPDSWTYLELSRTIGDDFYRFNTWRSFWSDSAYAASFPPLWPALLWMVNGIGDFGIHAGFILNFLIFAAFVAVVEAIARRSCGIVGVGPLSALMLLAFPPFVDEMVAARAVPLALLLIAAQVWLLVAARGRRWYAPALGLLAGLTVMSRFDFLPAAVGVVILAGLIERRWRPGIQAAVALGIGISPWVIYSITTFGKPFATDNAVVAISVNASVYVTDFYAAPPVTLFQDPAAWIAKIGGNLAPVFLALGDALRQAGFAYPLILVLGAVWFRAWRKPSRVPALPWMPILAYGGILLLPIFGYLATGYANQRYFAPQIWLLELFCLLVTVASVRTWRHFRLAAATVLGAVLLTANLQIAQMADASPLRLAKFRSTLDCLELVGARHDDTLIFVGDDALAAEFGALAGRRAAMAPRNWHRLDAGQVAIFLQRFQIRFAYLADRELKTGPAGVARLVPIPGCTAPVVRIGVS